MRIQNINQNNYRNRNITFKENVCALIQVQNCRYNPPWCINAAASLRYEVVNWAIKKGFISSMESFETDLAVSPEGIKVFVFDLKTLKELAAIENVVERMNHLEEIKKALTPHIFQGRCNRKNCTLS